MKVIFLDIDGVLNKHNKKFLDNDCIINLKKLVEKSNASIVLSTSWRDTYFNDLVYNTPGNVIYECHKTFENNKINVIGSTGHNDSRTDEIKDYIIKNNVTNYVALDDRNLFLDGHSIKVNGEKGLSLEDVEEALRILNEENSNKSNYDYFTAHNVLVNPYKQWEMLSPKTKLYLELL